MFSPRTKEMSKSIKVVQKRKKFDMSARDPLKDIGLGITLRKTEKLRATDK